MSKPDINTRPGLAATLVDAAVTAMAGLYGWLRTDAGQLVPSEFGANGEAIAFGSRESVFFKPVLIVLVLGLAFSLIPRLDRSGSGFARTNRGYLVIWVVGLSLAVFMFATFTHAAVSGSAQSDGRPFIGLLGAAVAAVGFFVPRTTYGYILGLRTKWTLASQDVWRETHRVVGGALVVLGLLVVLMAVVANRNVALGSLVAGLGVVWLAGAGYSQLLSRRVTETSESDLEE